MSDNLKNRTFTGMLTPGEAGEIQDLRDFADQIIERVGNMTSDPDFDEDEETNVKFTAVEGSKIATAIHRLCNACVSSPPPSGEVREAVARVIDPEAWGVYDQCVRDLDHPYLDQKVVTKAKIESSLLRAADILALIPTRDEAALPEPVGWTGSGSLAALKAGSEGFIWPTKKASHPVALYAAPHPSTELPEPCFECGSTERTGTACAPCNPELASELPADVVHLVKAVDQDNGAYAPIAPPEIFADRVPWENQEGAEHG